MKIPTITNNHIKYSRLVFNTFSWAIVLVVSLITPIQSFDQKIKNIHLIKNLNNSNVQISKLDMTNRTEGTVLGIDDNVTTNGALNKCKAGYNAGTIINDGIIDQAKFAGNFSYVVGIIENSNVGQLVSFIKKANDESLTPIIRMCYDHPNPEEHCADFKPDTDGNATKTIAFLEEVNRSLTPANTFVFIAGPNEPLTEKWMTDGDIPSNYAQKLAKYTKSIALSDANTIGAKIVSPSWNMHACSINTPLIAAYFEALGTDGREALEGIAGNSYGPGAHECYLNIKKQVLNKYQNELNSEFGFNHGAMLGFYLTEFGALEEPSKDLLDYPFHQLDILPETQAIVFFTPFGTNDIRFQRHMLSIEQINRASAPSCKFEAIPPINFSTDLYTKSSENILSVPYARYYEDDYIDYSINSCQVVEGKNSLVGDYRLRREGNYLVGYRIITAKVKFPGLNQWGSVNFDSSDSDNDLPFPPFCSMLALFRGNAEYVTTTDHPGILSLWSDNKRLFDLSIPKLGSAIGCLNLITNSEVTYGRGEAKDYRGFNFLTKTQEQLEEAQALALEQVKSKTTQPVFTKLLSNLIDFAKEFFRQLINKDTYIRDRLPFEPNIEYEENPYCQNNQTGAKISFVDKTAEKQDQLVQTSEQVINVERFSYSLYDICASNEGYDEIKIFGSKEIRTALCDLTTFLPKPLEDIDKLLIFKSDLVPALDNVSVPGGLSGFGKLFELIERKMPAYQHLIAPENGIILDLELNSYDPYNIQKTDLNQILYFDTSPDSWDLDPDTTFNYCKQQCPECDCQHIAEPVFSRIQFENMPFSKISGPVQYKFAMPFDLNPYLVALYYNFGLSDQSTDFSVKDNRILRFKKSDL